MRIQSYIFGPKSKLISKLKMGQQNSKDEMVYQQVIDGNVDAIKALHTQGAALEWIDKDGKTPLIVASMDPRLYLTAKTLIELGANLNAYRPGCHGGTPLHHAAKRGLADTVKLLLSNGANPFSRNDDCQTPLDVARVKGHCNVVRAIEAHVSYFSGDICEIPVVPGIIESFVPRRLSRKRSKKSWVVVVPCSLPNPAKSPKLELAVYNSSQDPQPRTVIALWTCHVAEPNFHESDPALAIVNQSSGYRYKFLSAIEGDRRQLTLLHNACKGFPQVMPLPLLSHGGAFPSSNEANAETVDSVSPHASTQSPGNTLPVIPPVTNSQSSLVADGTNGWGNTANNATHSGWGSMSRPPTSKASCSSWAEQPTTEEYNGWGPSPDTNMPPPSQPSHIGSQDVNLPLPVSSAPSAPPMPVDIIDDGPISYPAIDSTPVDLAGSTVHGEEYTSSKQSGESEKSSCVICFDAPVEGVCIPCGHMAGCMSCLTDVEAKRGECPICRAKIDQVIRVYAV